MSDSLHKLLLQIEFLKDSRRRVEWLNHEISELRRKNEHDMLMIRLRSNYQAMNGWILVPIAAIGFITGRLIALWLYGK